MNVTRIAQEQINQNSFSRVSSIEVWGSVSHANCQIKFQLAN